jgi:quinoprotein glucose dehydrogenase
MLKRRLVVVLLLFIGLFVHDFASAEDGAHGGEGTQTQRADVNEPGNAVKAPRTTQRYTKKGMTVDPVAIDVAPSGDIYVAEGSRAGGSVIDNRNGGLRRSNGVINDLQKTSVEDRLKQINMLTEGGFYPEDTFTKASDRVRLVRDTDGDGVADASSIFADNFNDPLDGIAAGVLYHDGKVYLTNIPHLWLLEDKDGDGDADKTTEGERTSLSYGWGIRWAFYGHDMHGLIKGPDGRIYFSIGDRGYNVTTKEGKQLYGPDRGAVFRMWPDGSGLELYFDGLRNPQELAFDNYGNLFTGDNNSDGGDKARFHYLPEGGEAGWSQDVQSLRDRGPWNREHMWKPRDVEKYGLDQPAWIIPPLKNVGRGPSGLTHYPGTGDVFPTNGSFLMCDYPAGVRHVYVKPDGAFFRVAEDSQLPVEGSTITDVTWGYDGRLYLSDWGGGWRPNPNGYIKVMKNEAAHAEQAEQIAEVKQLFGNGFEKLSDEKLIELLGHPDQRVRIHAQWEFASRENSDPKDLTAVLNDSEASELSKIHAIWTLGMMARSVRDFASEISDALDDPNPEVRSQAIATLGDLGEALTIEFYQRALKEKSPRVQFSAAVAAGNSGDVLLISPLLDLLDRNNNEDVAIRHAASYGLSLLGDADKIASEMKRRGSAARLGGVLALRRLDSPLLADFLSDEDPMVAAEAARAIYDKRIMDAMPALAALSDALPVDRMSEPVTRRVIEANVRLADQASAMRLGKLAANTEAPEMWRLLALNELDGWAKERNRDGVWGWWWPRPEQSLDHAATAMLTYLPATTTDPNGKVATLARTLMQRHVAKSTPTELAEMTLSADEPDELRLSTLQMLIDADATLATDTVKQLIAAEDASPTMRIQARRELVRLDLDASQEAYADAIESGTLAEQQDAIAMLGKDFRANAAIPGSTFVKLTDALKRGQLDPALKLDVIQAVQDNSAMPAPIRLAVQQYVDQNASPAESPFIREASLVGGSVQRGREIFLNQDAAQCQRCHAADGSDSVGPGLNGIAALHDANYLYDALVRPAAAIANGFANSTVRLKDGQTVNGRILTSDSTAATLVLTNADGVTTEIPRDQIEVQPITSDVSLMPSMTDKLSPMELRDVIAYLGSLRDDPSPSYRTLAVAGSSVTGPQVVKTDMAHALLLPGILIGIAAALLALLLMTMLSPKPMASHH